MAHARALVGHFTSSSQANEALIAVQMRGSGKRTLTLIQDVKTRWWSTWKMLRRLLELQVYFAILVAEEILDASMNLKATEWAIITEIESMLEPFMVIQRVLEGQKYVTSSLVPFLIYSTRFSHCCSIVDQFFNMKSVISYAYCPVVDFCTPNFQFITLLMQYFSSYYGLQQTYWL